MTGLDITLAPPFTRKGFTKPVSGEAAPFDAAGFPVGVAVVPFVASWFLSPEKEEKKSLPLPEGLPAAFGEEEISSLSKTRSSRELPEPPNVPLLSAVAVCVA